MYKSLLKPLLFLLSPEKAHHLVFSLIKFLFSIPGVSALVRKSFAVRDERLKRTVFGLSFENPVGLAAGFDKDALLFDELSAFGFGFIEIGTVTPVAQEGNPQPRMFRLPQDESLVNRMGFNNRGVGSAAGRLKKRRTKVIIGGNIGKNKVTANENAIHDYLKCFHSLFDHVDYFVVNVSSPNTPNLRELQEKEPLKNLLKSLRDENLKKKAPKPLLLKISPDLSEPQLDDIIEIVTELGIDGIIATNTTISREGLTTSAGQVGKIGAGGLSGRSLTERSTRIISYIHSKSGGRIPIIGVGGIHSAEDAIEKINAGASLVQIYTGFIYEGPGLVKQINKALIGKV
jgi:dihydroorotate dehydrogenase